MNKKPSIKKFVISVITLCVFVGVFYLYTGIYTSEMIKDQDSLSFEVRRGDSASSLADRLQKKGVISNADLFKLYVKIKGLDTGIHQGTFSIKPPFTIAKIAQKLQDPTLEELEITVIPGENLDDIITDLVEAGIGTKEEIEKLVGKTAQYGTPELESDLRILKDKPDNVSYEGYFRPDTYRFFKDATAEEIFIRLIAERNNQLDKNIIELGGKKDRTLHEVITMASIIEREVRGEKDKKMVADIFWKRHDVGMGLQADSTVHYVSQSDSGSVFTSNAERAIDNPWNTYKYPGLPPGPISTPSLESIDAAAFPIKNDYWYFLTDLDEGNVYYAETLEGHNRNVQKYLR